MAEKFRMIVERAKNTPAKDVAKAMLEHATPLMDPPPNEYPNKTDGNWVTEDDTDNPENYITTIGYGNRTPDELIAILKENNIQLVFDVRRIGTRARLRTYDHGANFKRFLGQHDIQYGEIQNPNFCIGNQYDSLDEYNQNIKTGVMEWLAEHIISYSSNTCFLCCELHAYKDDEPNCHRVHIADAVAEELIKLTGEPWGIEHL